MGFGQTICTPLRPKCGECELADLSLCPSAMSPLPISGVVRRIRAKKGEEVAVVKKEEKVEEEEEVLRLKPPLEESHERVPRVHADLAGGHDDVALGHGSTMKVKVEVKEEVTCGETRICSQDTVIATSSCVRSESDSSMPNGVGAVSELSQILVANVPLVKVES